MAFCINPTPLLKFRHFLILIGQHVPLPDALFLDILFSQAPLWLLGSLRNKPLFHGLLLRLSVAPWHPWHVNYNGFNTFFQDLYFFVPTPYTAFCDNNYAIHIAKNPTFHERTKHIEIDCHIIRQKLVDGLIHLLHVPSRSQLVYMFTKSLHPFAFRVATSKLGLYNLHAHLEKG